ncbi:unnamed protein product [Cochlearia groenlandica]
MCINNVLSILCFVLTVCFSYVSTQRCGDTLFFMPNGTYDTNRHLVLSTLASNVGSRNGFYNISVGEGPERIYVLGLCIPGTDPRVCSECIETASDNLLQKCPNQTDSWDWRADKTLCFVRYSNTSFFNRMDLEPTQAEYLNITFEGNLTGYIRTWNALMKVMITLVGRTRYLAEKAPVIDGSDLIYTLMQCIPGISPADCETCISESVVEYQNCCNGLMGGTVRRPVCFFRWDGYAYLGAFGVTPSPVPSQPTSPLSLPHDKKNISRGAIVGIVVSAVIFLALGTLGFIILKRRQ